MAKARALDKRRKSIGNIRKITRTMELVATAQFKKAMDRATAAADYTQRIADLVSDLARAGLDVAHPLLTEHESTENATVLVLTANRGMCSGYNSNVYRHAYARYTESETVYDNTTLEVSGKRGISSLRFNGIIPDREYTQFEDKPTFEEVDELAQRYLEEYESGKIDRLDICYTKFISMSKQYAVTETLLPISEMEVDDDATGEEIAGTQYEFMPSAESLLEEVVPMAFKVKLFKCFLDAAVSEQIARMIAMKAATDNADKIIEQLTMSYNRARQGQITSEILEVISGAEALA